MMRWTVVVILAVAAGLARPVLAGGCPTPDDFGIPRAALLATKAAIRAHDLTVLALGGSATLGTPAQGAEFTYPSRLAARLGDALPGVKITVVVHAVPRQPPATQRLKVEARLTEGKTALVILGPGGSAAGLGEDLDTFNGNVVATAGVIRSAGADLIMMTLRYAPSVARVVNLYPYRMAVARAGETAGLPVLDRYELMRFWSETGFLNLDVTDTAERVQVARKVYDCMAEILTRAIVDAVK
ncbi:MAG: SGNH/GDSL hydrolase family protein [Acetobacteraceae bacterium]|nr:SGNH/GDSL hydrolase family protein [Acetobacteraceae bacterium]